MQQTKQKTKASTWSLILMVFGPGLVVMLADTDAGSIITAAQSGALWGYKLLLLQFILMPIVFIAQELTVRLGIHTGKGHGELIKHCFGTFWAWLSVSTLIITCIGAIISEFSGLAGVAALFGIPTWIIMILSVIFLSIIVITGSYRSVERIALLFGAFELIFFVVAWLAHPSLQEMWQGIKTIPYQNSQYLYLTAANIGAVIMPWMIFYQQSAVVDKKLTAVHLTISRWDTAIGAVVTQLVMAAVLVTTAATIGKTNPGMPLDTVQQISRALTPFLGTTVGKILFAIGMTGAAFVAAIVVSLTAAWGLGEITGFKHSLEHHPREAPWFYSTYIVTLIAGAVLVDSGINLVDLNIAIEVMNALLLPIVLGFLFLLAVKALPDEHKLKGGYLWLVAIVLFITAAFGVFGGIQGI